MRQPHYPVKRTLDMAPTVSQPMQAHSDSGHFANKFVGSLVKARNSIRAARYHLPALLVATM